MTDLDRFAGFCEQHLRLENGRPLVLEPFQRRMLADYFAGTTETLILVPKKNGKTTLIAALALWHVTAVRDAECVIAAAARDQATIMLRQAHGFVRRSAGLRGRMRVTQREVISLVDGGRIRCLASDVDTADGVLPTLALVDELHRHKSADLYALLRDGLGPREGQLVTISTAGDDEATPLGKMRAAAYALPGLHREGAYRRAGSRDAAFVMHEWALDPADDLNDLELVATANPASWQTVEALRKRRESPTMSPWQWARFACGVWMRGENTAVSPLEWGAAAVPGQTIPDGEPISLGVDLGWRWDTTAIVPVWRTPENRYRLGAPEILVPPRDGTSIPVDRVFGAIETMADRWHVQRIVLDPSADGEHLGQRIEAELGIEVVAHSQRPEPMSLAAQRFTSALRAGELEHPDDQALTEHVLAAVPKAAGEHWRFVKHRRPIDALIAAAMALSVEIEGHSSVYERRGVLVFTVEPDNHDRGDDW